MQARSPSGSVLLSATFTVPQPQVTLATSQSTVVLELNPAQAPVTVNNFLAYVNDGFYTGTLFHRVIPNFMIQGGGYTSGLVARRTPYGPILLESNNGLSNLRGTVAMARTSVANSATSQFFINHVDNLFLNYSSSASPACSCTGRSDRQPSRETIACWRRGARTTSPGASTSCEPCGNVTTARARTPEASAWPLGPGADARSSSGDRLDAWAGDRLDARAPAAGLRSPRRIFCSSAA